MYKLCLVKIFKNLLNNTQKLPLNNTFEKLCCAQNHLKYKTINISRNRGSVSVWSMACIMYVVYSYMGYHFYHLNVVNVNL